MGGKARTGYPQPPADAAGRPKVPEDPAVMPKLWDIRRVHCSYHIQHVR